MTKDCLQWVSESVRDRIRMMQIAVNQSTKLPAGQAQQSALLTLATVVSNKMSLGHTNKQQYVPCNDMESSMVMFVELFCAAAAAAANLP